MRLLAFILCALTMPQAFSAEFYIGGMYGKSNLNYDVEGLAYKKLADNQLASTINSAISLSGNKVSLSSDMISPYARLFAGVRLSRKFSLEIFYTRLRTFSLSANTELGSTSEYATTELKGYGYASADLTSIGTRVNGHLPIFDNTELVAGIGIARVTASVKSKYLVTGLASCSYSNVCQGSVSGSISGKESYSAIVVSPLFSFGVSHRFDDFSLRSEVEILGVPVNGLSVITFSSGIQYHFN